MPVEHGLRTYGWNSAESTQDHAYTLPAILSLLPDALQGVSILDAGCGNGAIAGKLADMGCQVTGIDFSEDGIAIARKAHPNVRFEVASVYDDLRSVVDEVDVVVSSEVIEHLYYPQRYLENIATIIRPGGAFILTTPYHGYLKNLALSLFNYWDKHHTVDWEGGHIKFFSQKTLSRMLLMAGFSEITFNNAGRLPWLWKSMVCRARKIHD